MATLDPKLKQAAELASQKLNIEGVSPHFIASWFVSENGWDYPTNDANNFGNISFEGSGVPSSGLFRGVTSVNPNKTVNYGTMEDGITAFVELIKTPKADKKLTFDGADLAACKGDADKLVKVIGESNWASSHYDDGKGAGSLILDVYNSSSMKAAFSEESQAPKPAPTKATPAKAAKGHTVYKIQPGDALSKIALNHHVSLRSLEILNSVEDPNKIQAGAELEIPDYIRVNPGDTVTKYAEEYGTTVQKIAEMNQINPDFIFVGHYLFV